MQMVNRTLKAEGGVKITDELLDQWAAPWEAGEVPGRAAGFVSAPGRPRLNGEETKLVAFRLPMSVVEALDRQAESCGKTRSQRIRDAIMKDLLQA
jgi:hypothetical protein